MFGLTMLDVAIGMIFIFLLLSLICTAIQEILEKYLKYRASDLEKGISELLQVGFKKESQDSAARNDLLKSFGDTEELKRKAYFDNLRKDQQLMILETLNEDEKSRLGIDKKLEQELKDSFKLTQGEVVKTLYEHSLIASLYRGPYKPEGKNLPSYIPASNFAIALLDIVKPATKETLSGSAGGGVPTNAVNVNEVEKNNVQSVMPLRDAIAELPEALKTALLPLVDTAAGDINKVRANVENWFNTAMDRVAGWYKRRTQGFLIVIGLLLAFAINADSIAVYKSLSNDPPVRNALLAASQEYAKTPQHLSDTTKTPEQRVEDNAQKLYDLRLPIGWDWDTTDKKVADTLKKDTSAANRKASPTSYNLLTNRKLALPWQYTNDPGKKTLLYFLKFIGWFITALAISLGAPFWFDTLNKVMVIRSTVKPHEKSLEEASEDRQKKS